MLSLLEQMDQLILVPKLMLHCYDQNAALRVSGGAAIEKEITCL